MIKLIQQIERICLSPNSICNLKCKYCYFYNPDKELINQKKLTEREIYQILSIIDLYSKRDFVRKKIKLNFVGSGEPLLSWSEIKKSLTKIFSEKKGEKIRFYMVTNGTLITSRIAKEIKDIRIIPSVSIDGPPSINDKNRLTKKGEGSFNLAIKGLEYLHSENFDKIINTTITLDLVNHLEEYFSFVEKNNISKIIFGRLVDVPKTYRNMSYNDFYEILSIIYDFYKKNNLSKKVEIGNFESYKRAIKQNPDRVCTMFGSCCGAGISNIIYLQREVYPCGRMFNNENWKLGDFSEDLDILQKRMESKIPIKPNICFHCEVDNKCINDCILDQIRPDYNCEARKKFILKLTSDMI